MRRLLTGLLVDRRGATMALVVLFLPVLLSIIGAMLDGGVYLLERQKLGAALDAAAIQGAEMYEESLLWQGEEVTPCSPLTSSQCLQGFQTTCWQIWSYSVDSIKAEKAAEELGAKNYPDPAADLHVTVEPLRSVESELRLPNTPGEKPAGIHRWRVKVEGTGTAQFYFLRIVGLEKTQFAVFSAVTWQKQDQYRQTAGPCQTP